MPWRKSSHSPSGKAAPPAGRSEVSMFPLSNRARRAAWLTAYALAMGVLEAVVVVYLRALLYPDGFAFPLAMLPERLAIAEVVREAMTIVMLLAVAWLAGRDAMDRFFVFALL